MADVDAGLTSNVYSPEGGGGIDGNDHGAGFAEPLANSGSGATYIMQAWDSQTLEFFTWSTTNEPDFTGLQSGRLPVNLSLVRVLAQV